jgi:NADPH:quinone reductase
VRAILVPRFGGPEVLDVGDHPPPMRKGDDVRIRVTAATVNPTDVLLRSGQRRQQMRHLAPPYIPGMELAGVIDAAAPGDRWQVGDKVMAIVNAKRPKGGAQAELVVVPSASVVPVPAGWGLVEAATVPMNGLTVWVALARLALRPGQVLAVTGAAGAVGGYAIELGKIHGLTVVADAAPSDEQLVRDLGADHVVPRGSDGIAAIRDAFLEGVDGVIDGALIGGPILAAVRDGGAVAAVQLFEGQAERGITIHQVWVSQVVEHQAALQELHRLATERRLTPRIARTFPPDDIADAHRRLEAGGLRGRQVLVFF